MERLQPRYWTQTNPPYEVDFLIQRENDIFPVEVKAEANTSSRSMKSLWRIRRIGLALK